VFAARAGAGVTLVILRRILYFVLLTLVVLLAAVFAYTNPGTIAVDIGFARLDEVSMSAAFTSAFVFGWLFGLLCAGLALVKMSADRRRLRRHLRLAEAEVSSLRTLPLNDAD
jgi:uncharacterized membrane protein YciS (DUF1049 family)